MFKSLLYITICVVALCLIGSTTTPASPTDSKDLFAPVFITRPDNLTFLHCDTANYTFQAVSAVTGLPSGFIRYRLVSGPGSIDSITGEWTLPPAFGQGAVGLDTLIIGASELFVSTEGPQNLTVPLQITSHLPVVSFGLSVPYSVFAVAPNQENQFRFEIRWAQLCDSAWYTVSTEGSGFRGQVSVNLLDSANGTLMIIPDPLDARQSFELYFHVRNQYTQITRIFTISVGPFDPFQVRINSVKNVLQGWFVDVPVVLESRPSYPALEGFNLLLGYDNSALSLQDVIDTLSPLYHDCHWEYFAFRNGDNSGCAGNCPSGLIRIVGLADIPNNIFRTTCASTDLPSAPLELFRMKFLVSNNRTFACQRIPIQFYWTDCADNVLTGGPSKVTFTNRAVYHRDSLNDSIDIRLDTLPVSLPGFAGVPNGLCTSTYVGDSIRGNIDFYGGMVDIICAESIDARGCFYYPSDDYGNNYIAGYVMYSNYFLMGMNAFGSDTLSQSLGTCSDINADGFQFSVPDLVYLYRILVGDALPYPYPKGQTTVGDSSIYTVHLHQVDQPAGGVLMDCPDTVGAICFEFAGDAVVSNWSSSLHLISYFNGTTTRVLIAPELYQAGFHIPNGTILRAVMRSDSTQGCPLIWAQAGTARGARIATSIDEFTDTPDNNNGLPHQFSLLQNYPNPFNAGTLIQFDLPKAGNVRLDIINILGQTVWQISNHYSAGTQRISWNGTRNDGAAVSSGVYYYRLTSGSFVQTRKMVLLK